MVKKERVWQDNQFVVSALKPLHYLMGILLPSPFCISVPRYILRELNNLGEKNAADCAPRRGVGSEQS